MKQTINLMMLVPMAIGAIGAQAQTRAVFYKGGVEYQSVDLTGVDSMRLIKTTTEPPTPSSDSPNIILMLVDDIGMEALMAYGGTNATPNIDRMIEKGILFEECHASPLSTPSRVKLMTGKYNSRNYDRFGHLDNTQRTFATELRAAGYQTAIAGKWQLSYGSDTPLQDPSKLGFDHYCLNNVFKGYEDWPSDLLTTIRVPEGDNIETYTNECPRYINPLLLQDGEVVDGIGKYGPEIVRTYAEQFISENRNSPFMLYYTMMLTHDPFVPTPNCEEYDNSLTSTDQKNIEGIEGNATKYFKEYVTYMDANVGKILDKLEELKIADNTIVLLVGDNGTDKDVTNLFNGVEFQGGKGKTSRAGTHVPMVVMWPDGIQAPGTRSDELIDLSDFMPTLLDAAQANKPTDLDGISFYGQLTGESYTAREIIFTCFYGKDTKPNHEYAYSRRYKYYLPGNKRATEALYDMDSDIEEKNNLIKDGTSNLNDKQIRVLDELRTAANQYKKQ